MSTSELYQWSEEELQVPLVRRFRLHRDRLDYWQRLRSYYDENGTLLVLKSVENALFDRELSAMRLLLAISSGHNHTIPAEIVPCDKTSLIITPFLYEIASLSWPSLDTLTDGIQQLLEGLKFMHENGIAHFDIHPDNMMVCRKPSLPTSPLPVQEGKCYFIDFGSSKHLPPPPRGGHGDVCVPYLPFGGHFEPPEGRDRVNPYAYDIYCMGKSAHNLCVMVSYYALNEPELACIRVPPALWEFCSVLSRKDPKIRPPTSQTINLLQIAWRWNKMTQWLYWFGPYHLACKFINLSEDRDSVNLFGWRYMLWLTHSTRQRKGM
ncbi:hypothetical protein BDW22DRAFT_1454365 [Trametopsis cervina]|nr:hypothetical protein BDW22DRAFT_1454365 [Trametopsis cervina]